MHKHYQVSIKGKQRKKEKLIQNLTLNCLKSFEDTALKFRNNVYKMIKAIKPYNYFFSNP